jgi:4-amino-4-deoxy-L-arabinose transferase-like glycosyltransferase
LTINLIVYRPVAVTEQMAGDVEGHPQRRAFRLTPEGQPTWVRPSLLAVAILSAVLYAWRAGAYLEVYYAASVRSMSMSWHNFFFAAFDPAGTVTLDKLPGAFWIQALSVRAFGFHTWAIILPQVIEGVLSVLVLYRVVRRLSGPVAGLLAATVLALSPATVALNRGNIADTLMILLLLLAADAAVGALKTTQWGGILLAGLFVGLAFQAKMIEAWLVLPSLGLAYLIGAVGTFPQRLLRIAVMGVVAGAVSLSWMSIVMLTPASSRPYIDGSHDNSLFQQVFVYNGFGRLDQLSPDQLVTRSIGVRIPPPPPAAWNRLLTGAIGRDIGWLLPLGLAMLLVGLVATWHRRREDPIKISFVLWGSWLLVFAVILTFSESILSYYTAALCPAIAGLMASGFVLAWQERKSLWARFVIAAVVLVTAGYGVWVLPSRGTGLPGWLVPVVILASVVAAVAILIAFSSAAQAHLIPLCLAASAVAMLLVPTVASVSIASNRLGPFDTAFQPRVVTRIVREFFSVESEAELLPRLEQVRRGAPFLMATQTSFLAAAFIYVSGQEVLPIGGFTGTIPTPTLAAIESLVRAGDFHLVIQSPSTTDPPLVWIARNCLPVAPPKGADVARGADFALYYCLRTS